MSGDDSQWKPKNRPQSTIALDFSAALNDAFKIDGDADLGNLSQSVEQKKQAVSTQSQELEALEARLRATEERLKQTQSGANSRSHSPMPPRSTQSPARRRPISEQADVPSEGTNTTEQVPSTTTATAPTFNPPTRHPHASLPPQPNRQTSDAMQSMPGALPVTPQDDNMADYTGPNRAYAQGGTMPGSDGPREHPRQRNLS